MAAQKAKFPKLLNIDSKMNQGLKQLSKQYDIPVTEVIRAAIEHYLSINLKQ